MGNPAGVRRDFDALEQRRMKAVDLLRKGLSQSEVARQIGVHRQSVSRWAQQLQDGGRRSLRRAKQIGRPPRLTAADLRRVERGLQRGAEALGFDNGLWTSGRVAELIEIECGVRYHPSHVWRILRRLGWTCQRPTGRAPRGRPFAGRALACYPGSAGCGKRQRIGPRRKRRDARPGSLRRHHGNCLRSRLADPARIPAQGWGAPSYSHEQGP